MAEINLSAIAAGTGGFVINGQCTGDLSGYSVTGAGDVNGDGLGDLIVGAPLGDTAAGTDVGRNYVVFGRSTPGVIDLSAIAAGNGGFVVNGQSKFDRSGFAVAGAGDINGDGLADLLIGARDANPADRSNAGRSYVVFGKNSGTAVDLSAVEQGNGGFVVNGQYSLDSSGFSLAAAGDVNGDGRADLIIGAPVFPAGFSFGGSYVVFGTPGTNAINLSAIDAGVGGFVISGVSEKEQSGWSVSGAGDVNGDGFADLIIGANKSDPDPAAPDAGRSYVVFGKPGTVPVNLSAVAQGIGGFVINGQGTCDQSGWAVAGAGDVNGDGLADLVIGAPTSSSIAGRSFVVFGKTSVTPIDLGAVAAGSGGFVITGQSGDFSGGSVSAIGDLNGDGFADLLIGAPNGNANVGRSYVVFGKPGTEAVSLASLAAGTGGFVINGQCANDSSGFSVAGAGDVNGDGLADLIVGAKYGDPVMVDQFGTPVVNEFGAPVFMVSAGRSYLIFGSTTGTFAPSAVDQLGGSGNDALTGTGAAETLVGGTGNDTLTGNGGADVLLGGAGNDSIVVNAGNVAALAAGFGTGGNTTQLARIDGGTGLDTLVLAGAGITLDLRSIANQGAGTPGTTSRIESIERIDLTGSGNNTLKLVAGDVADMAGMNLINAGNQAALGWTNGSYSFAAQESRHQLIVDGNAGDVLTLTGVTWTRQGTVSSNGGTYTVYNSDAGLAQVLVANPVATSVQITGIDINLAGVATGSGGFVINGQVAFQQSGGSVASAGDVNGDGLDDLIVGSYFDAGRSYVVFGKTTTGVIDLSAITAGSGGFVINGQCEKDHSGGSVAGAGDVNGDGLADLLIGANTSNPVSNPSDPPASAYAGRSYVVFGKTGGTAIDLSAIAQGSGGFVINGQCGFDRSGFSVAGAGDVNGDGLSDVIVGAKYGDLVSLSNAGRSYLVFGKAAGNAVDLSAVDSGSGGFVINGQGASDNSGFSVAGAGDVNGDGLADLIVGAPQDIYSTTGAGRSYVVLGRTASGPINLSSVAEGSGGFVINGQCASDQSGWSVAGAGDVNGDGLSDVIIGAKFGDPGSDISNAGRSYVVFGRTATSALSLSDIAAGAGGFVINGQCAGDHSGISVAGAGDINGDGLGDLIVGGHAGDPAAGNYAGRSYVVFGKATGTAVNLSAIATGTGGFVINGQCQGDESGISVAAAGDINGDGLGDLIVGANQAEPNDQLFRSGRSYVIFGSTTGAFVQTAVDQLGGIENDTLTGSALSETLVGGAGNDTLSGAGGADVLQGGAGNDSIVVNASNIAALVAGFGAAGNTSQLARVDGGGGIDTLVLAGSALALDLTAIANQGGGTAGSSSRIESIERIDLTGSGNNSVTLGVKDILDMTGMNLFNDGGGWVGLGGSVQRHQLIIDGNAGDGLTFSDAADWIYSGAVGNGGNLFSVFNHATRMAQVLVDTDVLNVDARPTGSVTISGSAVQGQTLSASNTLADVNGLGTIQYQWKADGTSISGATGATLFLTQAQVGTAISVTASYTDGTGVAESVSSTATVAVLDVQFAPTAGTFGNRSVAVNQALALDLGAVFSDADGDPLNFVAIGLTSGLAIAGTTGLISGAAPTAPGMHHVTVTATDPGGASASVDFDLNVIVGFPFTANVLTRGNVALPGVAAYELISATPVGSLFGFRNMSVNLSATTGVKTLTADLVSTGAGADAVSLTWHAGGGASLQSFDLTGPITAANGWAITANNSVADTYVFGASKSGTPIAADTLIGKVTLLLPGTGSGGTVLNFSDASLGATPAPDRGINYVPDSMGSSAQISTTLPDGNVALSFSRGTSDLVVAGRKPITAADALDALKLSVGLTASQGSTWREFIAADMNHDGRVTAADALEILKASVGINTIQPSWVFVPNDASVNPNLGSMTRTTVTYKDDLNLASITAPTSATITGVLVGDVNNSWVIPP